MAYTLERETGIEKVISGCDSLGVAVGKTSWRKRFNLLPVLAAVCLILVFGGVFTRYSTNTSFLKKLILRQVLAKLLRVSLN